MQPIYNRFLTNVKMNWYHITLYKSIDKRLAKNNRDLLLHES